MTVRRATISTIIVAMIVAVALPVASLRLISSVTKCCCPDPSMCPDHAKHSAPTSPTMRACHHSGDAIVSPELPVFQPQQLAVGSAPARRATAVLFSLASPHLPPLPARPDAPS